jgi:hypothetical protein
MRMEMKTIPSDISSLPPALQAITGRLKFKLYSYRKVGRFETFLIDLSDWNLSLTDANPCIWVKTGDLEKLDFPELADGLIDVVRERRWQNSTVLVFIDGPEGNLRTYLPAALPIFVLFNANQQEEIHKADSPTSVTLDFFLQQMSRSQLAPYETHKPVVGSKFFGRRSEINKVLQHPDTNYLFIGIRRIGKTSLLKEIQRQMDQLDPPDANQIRRVYVDCTVIGSEDEFLRTLASRLDPSEMKMLMGRAEKSKRYQRMMFDRFADLHGGPITFLVDELDRLLAYVSPNSDLFDVLRAASNAGQARFIMAGFRRTMKAATNMASPFFNLATDIRLGRFKRTEINEMVLGPFERLRTTVQNRDSIVNRITRETASLPNYVQFYCKTLLEQLDESGQETITEENLKYVYENREFRDFILDTFMSNTEPLERALVYVLISEDNSPTRRQNFSQRGMDGLLKKRKLDLKYEQLDFACRNLEVAGVFSEVGKNFEFAVPLLQQILRETRDVDFLFEKTREEILNQVQTKS